MSFLNDLMSKFMPQRGESSQPSGHANLPMIAMAMLAGGGLNRLLDCFRQKGFGDAVQSWISTGPNKPVSGEQVHACLGDEKMEEVSQQTGLPPHEAASGLAQLLPQLVDHLTPEGKLPDSAGLTRIMETLKTALSSKAA